MPPGISKGDLTDPLAGVFSMSPCKTRFTRTKYLKTRTDIPYMGLRAPAIPSETDGRAGPLERVEELAHLEVERARELAVAEETHRVRCGNLIGRAEEHDGRPPSVAGPRAEEGVHF